MTIPKHTTSHEGSMLPTQWHGERAALRTEPTALGACVLSQPPAYLGASEIFARAYTTEWWSGGDEALPLPRLCLHNHTFLFLVAFSISLTRLWGYSPAPARLDGGAGGLVFGFVEHLLNTTLKISAHTRTSEWWSWGLWRPSLRRISTIFVRVEVYFLFFLLKPRSWRYSPGCSRPAGGAGEMRPSSSTGRSFGSGAGGHVAFLDQTRLDCWRGGENGNSDHGDCGPAEEMALLQEAPS